MMVVVMAMVAVMVRVVLMRPTSLRLMLALGLACFTLCSSSLWLALATFMMVPVEALALLESVAFLSMSPWCGRLFVVRGLPLIFTVGAGSILVAFSRRLIWKLLLVSGLRPCSFLKI